MPLTETTVAQLLNCQAQIEKDLKGRGQSCGAILHFVPDEEQTTEKPEITITISDQQFDFQKKGSIVVLKYTGRVSNETLQESMSSQAGISTQEVQKDEPSPDTSQQHQLKPTSFATLVAAKPYESKPNKLKKFTKPTEQ